MGVGLCLILLLVSKSDGLLSRRKRPHREYQALGGGRKKRIWKIADTLFEGDVLDNISDVNRAAPIIHAREQTSLNEAVFLGISVNIIVA